MLDRLDRNNRENERRDAAITAKQESAPVTDFEMAEAMRTFGGSFVQCLGRAWHHADEVNRAKILSTWADECERYRELARLKRARVNHVGE